MVIRAKEESEAGVGYGKGRRKRWKTMLGNSCYFKRVIKEGLDESICSPSFVLF